MSFIWWWGTSKKGTYIRESKVRPSPLDLTSPPLRHGICLLLQAANTREGRRPTFLTNCSPNTDQGVDESETRITWQPGTKWPSALEDMSRRRLIVTCGRGLQVKVEDLLEEKTNGKEARLLSAASGDEVVRIPGLALMYTDTVLGAPPLLPSLLRKWGALHKNLVLVTVRRVSIPTRSYTPTCAPGTVPRSNNLVCSPSSAA